MFDHGIPVRSGHERAGLSALIEANAVILQCIPLASNFQTSPPVYDRVSQYVWKLDYLAARRKRQNVYRRESWTDIWISLAFKTHNKLTFVTLLSPAIYPALPTKFSTNDRAIPSIKHEADLVYLESQHRSQFHNYCEVLFIAYRKKLISSPPSSHVKIVRSTATRQSLDTS